MRYSGLLMVPKGLLSSTCGVYQAESCRGERRGKLSVIVVLHNVVFYCFASWLTLGTYFGTGGVQWRLPLALQVWSLASIAFHRLTCCSSSSLAVSW
jgi:hypothetical protein